MGGRAFVVVVAPSSEGDYFSRLVSIIKRYRGDAFFILVSGEISGTDYKQLIQSGNADWASEQDLPNEIVEIIARHSGGSASKSKEALRPTVMSFVPSAGGVGNSTLAIETGVLLSSQKKATMQSVPHRFGFAPAMSVTISTLNPN